MDPLREAARRDPGAPAIESADRGWSYGELDAWSDRVALALHRLGLGAGEVVAVALPPSPELVALFHAAPRAGIVLLPMDPRWTPAERRHGLAAVGTAALLILADHEEGAGEAELGVPVIGVSAVASPDALSRVPGGAGRAVAPSGPDTPLVVLLTSGSTGRPRPVPLTRGNLEAAARGAAERLRLDASDRWLASLSPAHVGGVALIHRAAVVGCSLVVRPRFDVDEVVDLIERAAVTHASLVPTTLFRLLERWGERPAPRTLRCLLTGGAHTPSDLLNRALAWRFPVALTYGLTEASSQVATAPPDRVREKPGSVGRPLPGVELRVDPESSEIQVRGATVAPVPGVDREGWLSTGDLGTMDPDGDLRIIGRRAFRIVTGGVNVDPVEVEDVLARHPGVGEVAVLGVPDPEWGERVVAAVVPATGQAPVSAEDLLAFSRECLSPAKRPREVVIRPDLPRTATGKLDRRRLLAIVGPAHSP